MANGPPLAPIGTVGVGYVAVDDRVDVTLVVPTATVDEDLIVTVADLDVSVELFAKVDDTFMVVVDVFVEDGIRIGMTFGAGAQFTTRKKKSIQKLSIVMQVKRFMATKGLAHEKDWRMFLGHYGCSMAHI